MQALMRRRLLHLLRSLNSHSMQGCVSGLSKQSGLRAGGHVAMLRTDRPSDVRYICAAVLAPRAV